MEITSIGTEKKVLINGKDVSNQVNRIFMKLDPNGLPEVHLICVPMELKVTTDDAMLVTHDETAPLNDEPLTYEEMIRMPLHSDVWIQMRHNGPFAFAETYVGHGMCINFYRTQLPFLEYGKAYVCWRKRPTDEQMKQVKWKDDTGSGLVPTIGRKQDRW